jgi:signal peptidase I
VLNPRRRVWTRELIRLRIRGRRWMRDMSRFRVWARDIGISVIASLIIVTVLYQPVRVEGTSMQPGLRDQDRLFIDNFFFRFEKISRGDVIVFHYPRDPEKSYIKRVIALPGDSIFIDHGRVWVNGEPLDEPYVPRRYLDTRSMPEILIPSGDYFVMGDHRSISSDSRDFGPVDRDLIYGKATFIYWPADNMGVVR